MINSFHSNKGYTMKALLMTVTLFASLSAVASEMKVLEISAQNSRGYVSPRFEVNIQDATAGVSATVRRSAGSSRNRYTVTRTYEAAVAELSLNGKDLEFNKDGVSVVCGTMGVTRVFKIPTLILSGKCDLVTKKVNGKAQVFLVTE
jgi:hypothetical protein